MKSLGEIIKKLDRWDRYFLIFIVVFSIASLSLLKTPPTPDEGTHSLISLFFHDLFGDLVGQPTLSFSKIYNYSISYLAHYPKLSLYYPPLLHIIISLFYTVLGASFFTGRLVVLLFSIATLVIFYKFTKRFFDKKVALFSSMLFSTMPMVFYNSITVMTDIPYTFFFIFSMYMYLKAFESKKRKHFIFASIIAVLAFLTKWNSILIIPIIFAYALVEKRNQMKNVILSIVLIALLLTPYMIVIWKTGLAAIPFISSLQVSATAKQDPQFTTPEGLLYYLDVISTHYFTVPILIGSLAAMIFYTTQKKKHWKLLLLWFLAYYMFFTILSNKEPRYMMPLVPALLIPLSSFIVSEKIRMFIPIAIVSFALILSSTWQLVSQTFYYNPDFTSVARETMKSEGNILLATEPSWFYSSQFIFTLASMDRNTSKFVYRSCSLAATPPNYLFSNYGIRYAIISEPTDRDVTHIQLIKSVPGMELYKQFKTDTTDTSIYTYDGYMPQEKYCNFICVLNTTVCTNHTTPRDALK
jgi:hypothetical protein